MERLGEPIGVRLPPSLLARVDALAEQEARSRAQMVRVLVLRALEKGGAR